MRERIGPYQLIRPLGEGGMGVVYAARDERLGRSVALKLIRNGGGVPDSRERFWREARAAASVSHPNVCPIFDVGEEQGELFLAMELLEGEPLSARLARGSLPV
ncbi:MAG TPA: protein kinase, partial [Candidatus Eisenbacteria bacterium]